MCPEAIILLYYYNPSSSELLNYSGFSVALTFLYVERESWVPLISLPTWSPSRSWRTLCRSSVKALSAFYFGAREMKRTLMDSEFEVCFDLRLWTSGFCNLTAHYSSNHSFSARLNVIFLHYQTPSPECLFSELFAKWPLPSFHGEITMFTSPRVFHIISPSLAISFKCTVVGWHCCYSQAKMWTEKSDQFISHKVPVKTHWNGTGSDRAHHMLKSAAQPKKPWPLWACGAQWLLCAIKRTYVECAPSQDTTINPSVNTFI